MPWLNTVDYTIPELILFGIGCFLWVIAYAILIRNIVVYKKIEMPTIAGCGNFAWEFVYSFFIITDMGALMLWGYRSWLILDIFIYGALLKYGRDDTFLPPFKKNFMLYAVAITILWGILYMVMKDAGYETPIGAISAYVLNSAISILYVVNFFRLATIDHLSKWIAWLKTWGTGLISVFMVMHYPENHFIHFWAAIILFFDVWYIVLLHRGRREEERLETRLAVETA